MSDRRVADDIKDAILGPGSSTPSFSFIEFSQQTTAPPDPSTASGGLLWVPSGLTTNLIFTDNTGVDHNVSGGAPLVHTHTAADITSGMLPIARGGTGAATSNTALNNLLPTQTGNNGKVLSTDGNNTSWITSSTGQVNTVLDDLSSTGQSLKSTTSSAADVKLKTLSAFTNITITPSGTGDLQIATLATATQPEADAGTITNKIITPSTLSGYITGKTESSNLSSSATTYWSSLSTKQYADSIASGFSQKSACVIASLSDVDITTGTLTPAGLDTGGPTLNVDDHVLLKNQVDLTQNGVYHAKVGAWTRSDDMDGTPSVSEVTVGVATFVIYGATWGGYNFTATTPGKTAGQVINLGVDDINWTPISQISNDASTLTTGTLAAARLPTVPIASGGTGQTTASAAINALVPSQTGNTGKFLKTDGSVVSWDTSAGATNIDGLSDAYKSGTNMTIGFQPTNPSNYLSNNIFISMTEPVNIDTNAADHTIVGNGSLTSITTGVSTTIVGSTSGVLINTGSSNVIFGSGSGNSITSGSNNLVLGASAGINISTGTNNICIGNTSGGDTTVGTNNICIGTGTLTGINNASGKIVIGNGITAASQNNSLTLPISLATQAGTFRKVLAFSSGNGQVGPIPDGTSGQVLTTNGTGILSWTTISPGATTIDGLTDAYHVGTAISLGFEPSISANYVQNLFVSNNEPSSITNSAVRNVVVGSQSAMSLTSGTDNTGVGHNCLASLTTGANNISIGRASGGTIATGSANILIGNNTSSGAPGATGRIVIGNSINGTLDNSLTLPSNLVTQADGTYRLMTYGSGGQVAPITNGTAGQALISNGGTLTWSTITSGPANINGGGGSAMAIGIVPSNFGFWGAGNLMVSNTSPVVTGGGITLNTILGITALTSLTGGASGNTAIGANTGPSLTTGTFNTILGYSAGGTLTTGTSNTCIGYNADIGAGGGAATGRIVLGAGALGTVDNGLNLPTTLATQAVLSTSRKVLLFSSTTGQVGPIADGTSGQVLTTDGSGSLSWTTVASGSVTLAVQRFTTPGAFTYTPTSGMKYVLVELVGGGGGGGGVTGAVSNVAASGGGGSGGYGRFLLTAAQVGASLSGTVGAGGAGGTGNSSGTNGGNTTLATASSWTCSGGTGGSGSGPGATSQANGGSGGNSSPGTGTLTAIVVVGQRGGAGGGSFAGSFSFTGFGGSTTLGFGGSQFLFVGTTTTNGLDGSGYGSGGGGALVFNSATSLTGGQGANGLAIFTEYI